MPLNGPGNTPPQEGIRVAFNITLGLQHQPGLAGLLVFSEGIRETKHTEDRRQIALATSNAAKLCSNNPLAPVCNQHYRTTGTHRKEHSMHTRTKPTVQRKNQIGKHAACTKNIPTNPTRAPILAYTHGLHPPGQLGQPPPAGVTSPNQGKDHSHLHTTDQTLDCKRVL